MLKIKKIDIIICFLYLAIFKIYALPQLVQQISKIVLLLIVLLFIVSKVPLKKMFNVALLIMSSIVFSALTSWTKGNILFDKVLDGMLYAICIYCIYTLLQYCHQINYMKEFVNIVYNITIVYCIISFFSIVSLGTSEHGTEMTYFFGSKFATSYFYIFVCGLYLLNYYDKMKRMFRYKLIYFVLCMFSFAVSVWVHCNTSMMGSVFMLLALFIPQYLRKVMTNYKIIIISILIAGICVFVMDQILSIEFVQYIVRDVLGKSLHLTGRTHIYDVLLTIIRESLWWGYGYNSGRVSAIAGYGNAQNGLMEWMVNYGIIGVLILFFMVYKCTKYVNKDETYLGAYMVLYAMILCSIVEITFNYIFFMSLFLICFLQKSKENNI